MLGVNQSRPPFQVAGAGMPTLATAAATHSVKMGKLINLGRFENPKCLSTEFKFDGDYKINQMPLYLTVDPIDSRTNASVTGLRVWDCGIVMAKYLEKYVPVLTEQTGKQRLRGLELGSGSGIGGLALGLLGHDSILTDLGGMQAEATQDNLRQNQAEVLKAKGNTMFQVLDWRQLPPRDGFGHFDLVFASDVIWLQHFVRDFVEALCWSASGPGTGEFVLAHKMRDQESVDLFLSLIRERGFVITKTVETEPLLGQCGHPHVKMYHFRLSDRSGV